MRFMLLYHGPATPTNASHEGWPEWFSDLGDKLVERGSPMADGLALRGDGSTKWLHSPPQRLQRHSSRRPGPSSQLGGTPPLSEAW
jgi:hypothetical protein